MELPDGIYLLHIRIRMPGNIKKVRAEDKERDASVLQYKRIFNCKEYDSIRRIMQKLKAELAATAIVWPKIGTLFVVPAELLERVQVILDYRYKYWSEEVTKFLDNYTNIIQNDKEKLQHLFNEKDYPDLETLKKKFEFGYFYTKIVLPDTVDPRIEDKVKSAWKSTKQALTDVLYKEFMEIIQTIRNACDMSKMRITPLRSKTWLRLQEFLMDFNARNIANDESLAKMVEKVKVAVNNIEYEDINLELRKKLFVELDAILNMLKEEQETRMSALDEEEAEINE